MVDHRQKPFREAQCFVALPAASLGPYRFRRDHENRGIRLLDEGAKPCFPGLTWHDVVAVEKWGEAAILQPHNQLVRKRDGVLAGVGDEDFELVRACISHAQGSLDKDLQCAFAPQSEVGCKDSWLSVRPKPKCEEH